MDDTGLTVWKIIDIIEVISLAVLKRNYDVRVIFVRGLKLVLPSTKFRKEYLEMIEECGIDIKSMGFEFLMPVSDNQSFENDIEKLIEMHNGIGLPDGWVPASVFWLIDEDENENRIYGAIMIRPKLNEGLTFRGGHISYYIRPSERNKGYATKLLSLGLEYCKQSGIKRVLVTCSKDNVYSAKTIQNNGGVLESEDIENGQVFQRYWIDWRQL